MKLEVVAGVSVRIKLSASAQPHMEVQQEFFPGLIIAIINNNQPVMSRVDRKQLDRGGIRACCVAGR